MSALPELDNRFDVLAKLGEGGMGCVYKVRHRDLDEIQIVKTLQAHLSANEDLRNRFINEARRGMKLRHPHIAGVHDFHIGADGTGYIVMEYVHGLNLRDMLATRGALPLATVGAIAVQTLDALAYLHGERFVHRDISPDNLMLNTTSDGRPFVKLIDLGISKSLEAGQTMTATGQFLGKVSYASPEQFGGELDGRSDLYSLGVVLYKLLTNTEPFTGANYREIISAHLFQPPRPFEEAAPEIKVPEAVQRVVYRALEKDPDKRYRDAAEFCAAVVEAFDIRDAKTISVPAPSPRTVPDTTIATGVSGAPTLLEATQVVAPTVADTVIPGVPTLVQPRATRRIVPMAVVALLVVVAALGIVLWRRAEAARIASYGKFYAVVIGEGQYRMYPELPSAVDDARAVAQLLTDRYGFQVTKLENAGHQQIMDALRKVRLTPDDNLLIFYAGHGELKADKGYWQPVDADLEMNRWIEPANIRDVLMDHADVKRTLIIADSCYSGPIVRGALAPTPDAERKKKKSRIVISSGGNAPIVDSADGRHSIFPRALLEALADPGRKVIDVQGIFKSIQDRVVDASHRAGVEQKPELAVIADVGDDGGTFYFVPQGKR
jgi:tRNA A-37 threonylcarbamoyl transferase component Bud32